MRIKEFKSWKEARKVTNIKQLPLHLQTQLQEFIELYNPKRIELVGSFANGDWVTEDTPQYYKDLRTKITYKTKISDLDIKVYPTLEITTYKDIHINPMDITGVTIYTQ